MSRFSQGDNPEAVSRRRDGELAQFLRSHHSAISVEELLKLGYSADGITRLVARERLMRVHRGAYRSGNAAPTPETYLRCALVATGADAALDRASAVHHRGFIDFPPSLPQLVIPRRGAGKGRSGLSVRTDKALAARDMSLVNGLQCLTAPAAILALASGAKTSAEQKLLRRAIRQATIKHRGLPDLLSTKIERDAPFKGSALLRVLLDEHLPETAVLRSDLEADFIELLREAHLPLPETNAVVEGFEVDGVWRWARVVVELDTYAFHGDVRSFERDRLRDTVLTVAGYRPIRITQRRIEREADQTIRHVRSLLGL
jgi:very-short-patch-repair endonuclease